MCLDFIDNIVYKKKIMTKQVLVHWNVVESEFICTDWLPESFGVKSYVLWWPQRERIERGKQEILRSI